MITIGKELTREFYIILCIMIIALLPLTMCYAIEHGHDGGRGHGEWHGHGGWGFFIGPPPFYPYPYYGDCERVCENHRVPVCHYDAWGERWCHNEVVRDCRRVCY